MQAYALSPIEQEVMLARAIANVALNTNQRLVSGFEVATRQPRRDGRRRHVGPRYGDGRSASSTNSSSSSSSGSTPGSSEEEENSVDEDGHGDECLPDATAEASHGNRFAEIGGSPPLSISLSDPLFKPRLGIHILTLRLCKAAPGLHVLRRAGNAEASTAAGVTGGTDRGGAAIAGGGGGGTSANITRRNGDDPLSPGEGSEGEHARNTAARTMNTTRDNDAHEGEDKAEDDPKVVIVATVEAIFPADYPATPCVWRPVLEGTNTQTTLVGGLPQPQHQRRRQRQHEHRRVPRHIDASSEGPGPVRAAAPAVLATLHPSAVEALLGWVVRARTQQLSLDGGAGDDTEEGTGMSVNGATGAPMESNQGTAGWSGDGRGTGRPVPAAVPPFLRDFVFLLKSWGALEVGLDSLTLVPPPRLTNTGSRATATRTRTRSAGGGGGEARTTFGSSQSLASGSSHGGRDGDGGTRAHANASGRDNISVLTSGYGARTSPPWAAYVKLVEEAERRQHAQQQHQQGGGATASSAGRHSHPLLKDATKEMAEWLQEGRHRHPVKDRRLPNRADPNRRAAGAGTSSLSPAAPSTTTTTGGSPSGASGVTGGGAGAAVNALAAPASLGNSGGGPAVLSAGGGGGAGMTGLSHVTNAGTGSGGPSVTAVTVAGAGAATAATLHASNTIHANPTGAAFSLGPVGGGSTSFTASNVFSSGTVSGTAPGDASVSLQRRIARAAGAGGGPVGSLGYAANPLGSNSGRAAGVRGQHTSHFAACILPQGGVVCWGRARAPSRRRTPAQAAAVRLPAALPAHVGVFYQSLASPHSTGSALLFTSRFCQSRTLPSLVTPAMLLATTTAGPGKRCRWSDIHLYVSGDGAAHAALQANAKLCKALKLRAVASLFATLQRLAKGLVSSTASTYASEMLAPVLERALAALQARRHPFWAGVAVCCLVLPGVLQGDRGATGHGLGRGAGDSGASSSFSIASYLRDKATCISVVALVERVFGLVGAHTRCCEARLVRLALEKAAAQPSPPAQTLKSAATLVGRAHMPPGAVRHEPITYCAVCGLSLQRHAQPGPGGRGAGAAASAMVSRSASSPASPHRQSSANVGFPPASSAIPVAAGEGTGPDDDNGGSLRVPSAATSHVLYSLIASPTYPTPTTEKTATAASPQEEEGVGTASPTRRCDDGARPLLRQDTATEADGSLALHDKSSSVLYAEAGGGALAEGCLVVQCLRCGHGGHVEHIAGWWKDATVRCCPKGCDCVCFY